VTIRCLASSPRGPSLALIQQSDSAFNRCLTQVHVSLLRDQIAVPSKLLNPDAAGDGCSDVRPRCYSVRVAKKLLTSFTHN
jgi:hypothetical protein